MRRAYYIIASLIVVIMTVVLIACHNDERDKLYVAEKMFDKKIDSVPDLLKEIDTTRLSAGDKAFWHMLNIRYRFYTHNPDYPDSLSARDERLLIKRNRPAELQELYFWKANRNIEREEWVEAVINLDKSSHYLDSSKGDIAPSDKVALRAHTYKLLAFVWRMLGDQTTAVYYNDAAIGTYSALEMNMVSHKAALLDKVSLYESFDNYKDALNTLDTIQLLYKDKEFILSCKVSSLYPLIGLGAVDSVRKVLDELDKEDLSNQRIRYAEAWLALQNGDYETSLEKIKSIRCYSYLLYGDTYKPERHIEFQKKLEEGSGNLQEALKLGDTINFLNKNVRNRENQLIARNAVDRYRAQQKEILKQEAHSARIILVLIVILSIIAVAGLIMAGIILIKRHRRQADELLEQINDLRISDDAHRKSIHSLVRTRFDALNRLCDDYLELSELKDKTAVKNEIYKNVNTQLMEMRSAKFKTKLAESVNTDLDGIIDRFKTIEGITKDDEDLFLYLSAGFSVKAVGVFLDLKKSSIYTRRRRLREKIEQSESPYKEELLKYI